MKRIRLRRIHRLDLEHEDIELIVKLLDSCDDSEEHIKRDAARIANLLRRATS